VSRDDVDDATFDAITSDREAETYQFVVKAVRDDADHALDKLSTDLIDLSDQFLDQSKLTATLRAENDELTAQVDALEAQRTVDTRDLAHLREQREAIKRYLPGPLRRFVQKQFGIGPS
jgi:BMFP domain-containing protein YqiC